MDNSRSKAPNKLDLLRQREQLLQMKAQITGMLGELDAQIAGNAVPTTQSARAAPAAEVAPELDAGGSLPRKRGRPVRAVVLDALEEIGWPTYSRELSQFCSAWLGRRIQPERFGSLASDEAKAFQRSIEGSTARPVWLCFALTHDRHQPIKRLWCRSDWPLDRRIIAPTAGRVQHLKLTAKLCELAQRDGFAEEPEMMRIIAADHARDLPGVRVQRGKFELDAWRYVALELLRDVEPRDAEARHESAIRLQARGPFIQLFGVPEAEEVDAVLPQHQQRRG